MLESIGISLISTMISFLFETQVLRTSTVEIDGAPYWYAKQNDPKKIYISTYIDGDISKVDKAKGEVVQKITLIIEEAYKITMKKELVYDRSKKELEFLKRMEHDTNLKNFVKQNTVYQNIKYDEDIKRVFVRGYLPVDVLKKYQEERIAEIKKQLLDYQFDDMMDKLDKEAS